MEVAATTPPTVDAVEVTMASTPATAVLPAGALAHGDTYALNDSPRPARAGPWLASMLKWLLHPSDAAASINPQHTRHLAHVGMRVLFVLGCIALLVELIVRYMDGIPVPSDVYQVNRDQDRLQSAKMSTAAITATVAVFFTAILVPSERVHTKRVAWDTVLVVAYLALHHEFGSIDWVVATLPVYAVHYVIRSTMLMLLITTVGQPTLRYAAAVAALMTTVFAVAIASMATSLTPRDHHTAFKYTTLFIVDAARILFDETIAPMPLPYRVVVKLLITIAWACTGYFVWLAYAMPVDTGTAVGARGRRMLRIVRVGHVFFIGTSYMLIALTPYVMNQNALQSAAIVVDDGPLILVPLILVHELLLEEHGKEKQDAEAREVRHKMELLQSASKAQHEFLSYVFHEIRVPFQSVVLGIDELTHVCSNLHPAPPGSIETLQLMQLSTDGMQRIIDGVLAVEKIDAGRFTLDFAPMSMSLLINTAEAHIKTRAAHDNVKLQVHIDPAIPPCLLGDFHRLLQVTLNFATNAIKFSRTDGTGVVTIKALVIARYSSPPVEAAAPPHAQRSTSPSNTHLRMSSTPTRAGSVDDARAEELMHALQPQVSSWCCCGNRRRRASVLLRSTRLPSSQPRASATTPVLNASIQESVGIDRALSGGDPNTYMLPFSPVPRTVYHVNVPDDASISSEVVLVRIACQDNGCGISEAQQKLLFQRFVQIDAGVNQKGNGTGLGLHISKEIVKRHGGDIRVVSEQNVGSEFFIDVPLRIVNDSDSSVTVVTDGVTAPGDNHMMAAHGHTGDGGVFMPLVSPPRGTGGGSHRTRFAPAVEDTATTVTLLEASTVRASALAPTRDAEDMRAMTFAAESAGWSAGWSGLVQRQRGAGAASQYRRSSTAHSETTSMVRTSLSAAPIMHRRRRSRHASYDGARLHPQAHTSSDSSAMISPDASMPLSAVMETGRSGVAPAERSSASRHTDAAPSPDAHLESRLEATPPTLLPSVPVHTIRLLVVDDVLPNRRFLARSLQRRVGGSMVEEAVNGLEVLNLIRAGRSFDVICMDDSMPVMTGKEASTAIRALGYAGIIIGVTGNALDADQAAFRAAGANAVFTKPVDLSALARFIHASLSAQVWHQSHSSTASATPRAGGAEAALALMAAGALPGSPM